MQTKMSFLIDTNVVIAAEPYAGELEPLQSAVSTFLRIAGQHGHDVLVHPATLDDLRETANATHRAQNIAAYAKYAAIEEIPIPDEVRDVFPAGAGPNDQRDARILTALHVGAVDFLVTNDSKLRRRAIAIGHEARELDRRDRARAGSNRRERPEFVVRSDRVRLAAYIELVVVDTRSRRRPPERELQRLELLGVVAAESTLRLHEIGRRGRQSTPAALVATIRLRTTRAASEARAPLAASALAAAIR